jgi:hypothetical protein
MALSDNPIRLPGEDTLGRATLASDFVRQVLAVDVSQGAVVGVLGPWGQGKTSFVNLAKAGFDAAGIAVLEFNPWMFSGAEALIESFFVELSAQLRIRAGLTEIAADFASYGDAFSGLGWLPAAGPWIERARGGAKILQKLLESRKQGVGDRRAKLTTELTKLDQPIVVVLDDIDRLTIQEIRDVFRLVRLTASFPNIVYLLAFDRARVESALAEQGIPGRAYLEKILQIAVDLPPLSEAALTHQALSAIDATLTDVEQPGRFDTEVWPDVFLEVIRPSLTSMRDVRRYAMAIRGTVESLRGEVALVDVLGLESIRVFLPEVFALLHSAAGALTTTSDDMLSMTGSAAPKSTVEALVDAAATDAPVVRAMITRLFPAAARHFGGMHYGEDSRKRWLRERRVAHRDILLLCLERLPGGSLTSFLQAERAWEVMDDIEAFGHFFTKVDPAAQQDVIAALEAFEGAFRKAQVVPGMVVLLNLLPDLPDRRQGMFDLEPRFVVGRIVYRLLRALDDEASVAQSLTEALPQVSSLSSRFELITDVGYREDAGHQLVTADAAEAFERQWLEQVRSATPEFLGREWDLLRVMYFARKEAEKYDVDLTFPDDPTVTLALILSAVAQSRSQTVGARVVRTATQFHWDMLESVAGGAEAWAARVETLKRSDEAAKARPELLALVDQYLAGWRPRTFGQ